MRYRRRTHRKLSVKQSRLTKSADDAFFLVKVLSRGLATMLIDIDTTQEFERASKMMVQLGDAISSYDIRYKKYLDSLNTSRPNPRSKKKIDAEFIPKRRKKNA